MARLSHSPTRPQTRIWAHAGPAVLLALLLLAVAPGVEQGTLRLSGPSTAPICDPEALTLHARVDEHRLGQGGQDGAVARLRLEVEGTQAPVLVELINRTPGVVGLEGGDVQVASTTGGADNHLEREVLTHRAGDLEIRYHLTDSPCSSPAPTFRRPNG